MTNTFETYFTSIYTGPQTLKLDGSFTTDPVLMAERFNNYFSKVGALLAEKIESSKENTFKTYMSKSQKEYLHRSFSTQQILQKFLTSLLLLKPANLVVMTTFLHFS